MYNFIYENESEFKMLERGLKKINMLAYKKLMFEIYPNLKNGNLEKAKKNGSLYEIDLPTDKLFLKVYGQCKLIFTINDNNITLIKIVPEEMLKENHRSKLSTYKGVMLSNNHHKDIFKIDLLNRLQK